MKVETERKYDVDGSAAVPDLTAIPGVARADAPVTDRLEASYFDTDGLDLAVRGITLRRRSGGIDPGWYLKIPVGADRREEVHEPLGQPERVPDSLQDRVMAYTRGRMLKRVAVLSTERITHRLYGADGAHIADLADDRVDTQAFVPLSRANQWREWELETTQDTDGLLDAAGEALRAAGASPSAHGSKLAKAFGDSWPAVPDQRWRTLRKRDPVTAVPVAYLGALTDTLLGLDHGVRREEPDAVHQMRSTVRRARSALGVYGKLFKKARVKELQQELKWLAGLLGRVRDAEVLRLRITDGIHALREEHGTGPLFAVVELDMDTDYNISYQRLAGTLGSDRYFRLLGALESFRDRPPAKGRGSTRAKKGARKLVNKAAKRLDRAQKAAAKAEPGKPRDLALHQIRKDAKRLRHAAESIDAIGGKRARKLGKSAKRLQQILGEHQDSVIASAYLQTVTDRPGLPADAAAASRELGKAEERNAAAAEARYRKARKKSYKARL